MADRSFAGGPPYPERMELDRSRWLRLLRQELRCSLGPGLNHGPSIGPRLALALSCERIRHAIPFLPTESFRIGYPDLFTGEGQAVPGLFVVGPKP
jgi:hypothetical protein